VGVNDRASEIETSGPVSQTPWEYFRELVGERAELKFLLGRLSSCSLFCFFSCKMKLFYRTCKVCNACLAWVPTTKCQVLVVITVEAVTVSTVRQVWQRCPEHSVLVTVPQSKGTGYCLGN
jgi:hypothetical protein